jgi:periplasmic protein CpxP/Spy
MKMQSKTLLGVILLSCLVALGANGLAQDNKEATKSEAPKSETPKTQTQTQNANRRGNQQDRVAMMAERLGLNDEQKTKLKEVVTAENKSLRELRADPKFESLSAEEKRTKTRQIRDQSNEKINAFLTDEQKKKYKDMQEQVRQRGNRRPQAQ